MNKCRFEGKTALITGGGTGIGYGTALRLLQHGAIVTIAGRRADVLEDAATRLRAAMPAAEVRVAVCDVTVEEQVENAVRTAADANGRLDIAVANAGTGVPGPILALSAEQWRYACDLNIMGTAFTIKHAALRMREHGGSIVAISSAAGFRIPRYMATYGATKAGLEMLVRCAAVELAPFAIRVNTIRPGFVPTEGALLGFNEDEQQDVIAQTPLDRLGESEDIADAVVYFCTDNAGWVTGQTLSVDGGLDLPRGEDFEGLCRRVYGDALMDSCIGPATPDR